MSWIQCHIALPANRVDALSDCLMLLGAVSTTTQDAEDKPIFEVDLNQTPLWQQVILTALFDADADIKYIESCLKSQLSATENASLNWETIEDQCWERAWLDHFKPQQFGKRLWVTPSNHSVDAKDAITIEIDPGLAFGTGNHETTAMCLEWLDSANLINKTLIDYGCGSGLLAIAGLKLDATHAFCVDTDPQALTTTLENAEKNQLDASVISAYLPDEFTETKADVLIANILANPLVELAPRFASHLDPNGLLVLSGILTGQKQMIIDAYSPWFEVTGIQETNGWLRIDLLKKR